MSGGHAGRPRDPGQATAAAAVRARQASRRALENARAQHAALDRALALCVHRHRLPPAEVPCLDCRRDASGDQP